MGLQQVRPFRKLLVANRGEIAVRILNAARELDLETYAVFTESDSLHTYNAAHALKLPSPSSYSDVVHLIQVIKDYSIDAVHPGYGFLSESAEFARRVREETGAVVIGPGADVLSQTADKLAARRLAEMCRVPTLPALLTPTNDVEEVSAFARNVGYPVMIKALDGGGGRGIRLVPSEAELPGMMARAVEESPSRQVFAEKAAAEGFHHVEIQIVGDLHGNIIHMNERDCSIRRGYQKVVEMAPSMMKRDFVDEIIDAAIRMAKKISYVSLGTFEFLSNSDSGEYYFLEVNPRLQVEHTVSESIARVDLVQAQILIAQGASVYEAGLSQTTIREQSQKSPQLCSLQLRITAEDVTENGWSLSVGKIQSFHFPSGNGIRVDTNLVQGAPAVIGSDFDSLIAKLVITAATWQIVFQKAKRALEDTSITGIKTNLGILRAIVAHDDFAAGKCDTSWLQTHQTALLDSARDLSAKQASKSPAFFASNAGSEISAATALTSSSLFRKGDAWKLSLEPKSSPTPSLSHQASSPQPQQHHHLELTKVLRNDFPTTFSAEVALTAQDSPPKAYILHLQSTSASASALSSKHRRGSPKDPSHVIIPFAGKLVEFHVDVGDAVERGDVVCVVKQMKMELEVRASRAGVVAWVTDAEDDEDVAEGTLAAVVEESVVMEEKEVEEGKKMKVGAKL